MSTVFQTFVVHLPPTPLGLLPERWSVTHRCMLCGATVAGEDLVAHASDHVDGAVGPARERIP